MKKTLFIGIDFSKSKFDVTALESAEQGAIAQATFENNQQGYKDLLKWVKKQAKIRREDWLFCGEHTGLYSRGLGNFLAKEGLFIWLENPLEIKQSSGVKRIKTDRADSLAIANYACRFHDQAKAYQMPSGALDALRLLFTYRRQLLKQKVQLEVSANEMRRVFKRNTTARFVFEDSIRRKEQLSKDIKRIEKQMHEVIMESEMRENYLLALSVKGIGLMTAVCLLIHTDNFRAFENVRQIACYCGVAPFPNQSGTIDKGTHINRLANRELKVLLTQGARSAVQHDKELSAYYQRKLAQGKNECLVINNVRNKLLQRVFAVVKSKIPYRENYLNPWAESA